MTTGTLTLSGKKFVVIPASEYRQLKASAAARKPAAKRRPSRQERGDIAESLRRLKDERRVPLDEVAAFLNLDPVALRK